jgi:hypothetical protein
MNMILLSFDERQEFEEKVFFLRTFLHIYIYIYIHTQSCNIITQDIYMIELHYHYVSNKIIINFEIKIIHL